MISPDPSQRTFCESDGRYLRLLAPAGSGKTMAILWRCVRLLAADPEGYERALIVTFTRAACDELIHRVRTDDTFAILRDRIVVRTLNQWGYAFLRKQVGPRLELVSPEYKHIELVRNHLKPILWRYSRLSANFEARRSKYSSVLDLFDTIKTTGLLHDSTNIEMSLEPHLERLKNNGLSRFWDACVRDAARHLGLLDESKPTVKEQWHDLLHLWQDCTDALWNERLITFEDQKYWSLLLLKTEAPPEILGRAQRFAHIMVDEFQDINPLDLALILCLVELHKSTLTIVGDDDQAIFEWRGSSPKFILAPQDYFQAVFESHLLEVNYRSPENIVDISQQLIRNNPTRIEKRVRASTMDSAEIQWIRFSSHLESLNEVLQLCIEANTSGIPRSVAIITRKRSQLVPLQIMLSSRSIPFYAKDDLNVLASKALRDLLEILDAGGLKKVVRTSSELARTIVHCLNKIGRYPFPSREGREVFTHIVRSNCQSFEDAVIAFQSYSGSLGSSGVEYFAPLMELLGARSVRELVLLVERNFKGFADHYATSGSDIFYSDPPFFYLLDLAESYGRDFESFVAHLRAAIKMGAPTFEYGAASHDPDPDLHYPVQMMTALRAKGREFKDVIILDVNDGIWPSRLAQSTAELEAERRLFYVAVTRARQRLVLLSVDTVRGERLSDSPYLAEMGLRECEDRRNAICGNLPSGKVDDLLSAADIVSVSSPAVQSKLDSSVKVARHLSALEETQLEDLVSDKVGVNPDNEEKRVTDVLSTGPSTKNERNAPKMSRLRIEVQRDIATENAIGIALEGASAFYDEKSAVIKVLGELVSIGGKYIKQTKKVQIVTYADGSIIIGRNCDIFWEFGTRQSFDVEIKSEDKTSAPTRVVVYPTSG